MREVETDLVKTAKAEFVQQAVANFATAWAGMTNVQLKMDASTTLRKAFLSGDEADRINVDNTPGGVQSGVPAAYGFNHSHYNPMFRAQIQGAGYSDFYLLDLNGNVVYSTTKHDDFGANVADGGQYADTGLGKAYQAAMTAETADAFAFADFSTYVPDGGAPRMFFATPVFDASNVRLGVVAISLGAEQPTKVIGYRQGLGQTGDTIIVGEDGLARSDSGSTKESELLQPTLFDDVIKAAVDGVPGDTIASNFRGADVIAAAAPADVTSSTGWAVVAVMNRAEIFAPVATLTTLMLVIGGALLVVVAALGWLFARSVSQPITRLTRGMNALAQGNLDVEIKGADKTDELGQMARAVEVFRANARQVEEMSEGERALVRTAPPGTRRHDAAAAARLRRSRRRGGAW